MPDQDSAKLRQAIETALGEAKRLDLQLLTYILTMAQLELESRSEAAMPPGQPGTS